MYYATCEYLSQKTGAIVEPEMENKTGKSSWMAFLLFYVVLLVVISVLDWANGLLDLRYWLTQVGLVTLGVVVLAGVGLWLPDLSAARGVFLAFTVGVLTIIPAVLMGMARFLDFWRDYFSIALGMASGSLLSFLFLKIFSKISR
jgi:hypothetical protein